jgi:hypothetical protein
MPQLDLLDETFIVAAPRSVAATVADPARWAGWWPGLTLAVQEDRGIAGIRWLVGGSWIGSMEIWLEPHLDGVIAHYYLRIDPAAGQLGKRALRRQHRAWARRGKRVLWALKDELEQGRGVGDGLPGPVADTAGE